MASRRAGRPWWGVGARCPPSDRTCRVSRAQRAEGKQDGSACPLFRSSLQRGAGASGGMGAGPGPAGRRWSTRETKNPSRGRAST